MFDSPASASAYDVLGVAPTADEEALRRAFRRRLRETHPDTGGDAAMFIRVQRAWELVGTAEDRLAYDRGRDDAARLRWDGGSSSSARGGTRPRSRTWGTAGAWRRSRYRAQARQESGRALSESALYDPAFIRSLSWDARRMLAAALAEEATAYMLDDLGMGFTVWHDVATDAEPAHKLDHIVLSPTGLYGLASEDFGGGVGFRAGEVRGEAVGEDAPVAALVMRMHAVARNTRVRFGGGILVLPDDDLTDAVTVLGSVRGVPIVVVRQSVLGTMLRSGVPGARRVGGNELFDVRTRLQHGVVSVALDE